MKNHLSCALVLSILSMLSLGCGSTSSDTSDGDDEASAGVDQYFAGIEKAGEVGVFTVELQESVPVPRYVGLHSWTLRVRGTDGLPIVDAHVEAEPIMVAHGHGTSPSVTSGIEDELGQGTYVLSDMDLFMPGVWTVFITIETLDGRTDTVSFSFDLEG